MGVIDLRIPASYIITFVVFILLFGGHGFDMNYVTAQLCGGGLMLGAFFMATDYVTSPITPRGTDHFWYLLWYFHRTVPLLRSQCRRSFLCNYLKQPLSSYDREIHSTKRFWCCENKPEKEASKL